MPTTAFPHEPRSMQTVSMSAIAACPTRNVSASHYSYFHIDGKCNHDRVCGYIDENGGPCTLPVDGHPKRGDDLVHDDGVRFEKGKWRR